MLQSVIGIVVGLDEVVLGVLDGVSQATKVRLQGTQRRSILTTILSRGRVKRLGIFIKEGPTHFHFLFLFFPIVLFLTVILDIILGIAFIVLIIDGLILSEGLFCVIVRILHRDLRLQLLLVKVDIVLYHLDRGGFTGVIGILEQLVRDVGLHFLFLLHLFILRGKGLEGLG